MVRQLLHSTTAYAKFTLAMRNFRRLKAFAGIKNEVWCMDIANVDKQTKYTIGVFSFLVRQDLFDNIRCKVDGNKRFQAGRKSVLSHK